MSWPKQAVNLMSKRFLDEDLWKNFFHFHIFSFSLVFVQDFI